MEAEIGESSLHGRPNLIGAEVKRIQVIWKIIFIY